MKNAIRLLPDEIEIVSPAFKLFAVNSLDVGSTESDNNIRWFPSGMPADLRISFPVDHGITNAVEGRLAASESNEGGTHSAASLFRVSIFFTLVNAVSLYYVFEFVRWFLENSQATIILQRCQHRGRREHPITEECHRIESPECNL